MEKIYIILCIVAETLIIHKEQFYQVRENLAGAMVSFSWLGADSVFCFRILCQPTHLDLFKYT